MPGRTPGLNRLALRRMFAPEQGGGTGAVDSVTSGGGATAIAPNTGAVIVTSPAFSVAAPPNLGSNVGTAGAASSMARADARPGQNLVAQWALGAANRRVYLVDGANGNDANPGFLDGGSANFPVSGATVAATAKKTLAALDTIFPRIGNGRHVEVIIANGGVNTVGTYTDALESFLNGTIGYAANCPIVRGTGTNATASATAFGGDAADNTYQGAITVTGLNVAGYNPTGAPTNQVIQCLKVGGAAPAFPAEPAAPLGWRIRFDSATTTAALRNVCRCISVVTTDTLTLATTLPAVPALTDTFYVEQAGWTFPASTLQGVQAFSGGNGGGRGLQIVGGRCTGNLTCNGIALNMAFAGCGTLGPSGGNVNVAQNFQSATLGSITVGGGCHGTGNFSSVLGGCFSLLGAVFEGFGQVLEPVQFNWKIGAVFGTGLQVKGSSGNDYTGVNSIGSENGQLGCRILGANATTGAGLHIGSCKAVTGAIAITGCTARPGVLIDQDADVSQLPTTILSGATGNTDVGLAFIAAGATVPGGSAGYNANGNANTISGTLGDVRLNNLLSAGQIVTWASINATGIADSRGNRIIGSAGSGPVVVVGKFTGKLTTDPVVATVSHMADPGASIANANLEPQRYPTSARLVTRLRVTQLNGPIPISPTVTLYKNGVATTMTVTITAASPQYTVFSDTAHPVLLVDGDTFDVRIDDPGGGGGTATVVLSAILEGPA